MQVIAWSKVFTLLKAQWLSKTARLVMQQIRREAFLF